MTISSLITELQKLQALHGDLPVTAPDTDGGDHDVIASAEFHDDRYWDVSSPFNGPHIHLS